MPFKIIEVKGGRHKEEKTEDALNDFETLLEERGMEVNDLTYAYGLAWVIIHYRPKGK